MHSFKTESALKLLGRILVPDHIRALSRGGDDSIFNIQVLCHSRKRGVTGGCNERKGARFYDCCMS